MMLLTTQSMMDHQPVALRPRRKRKADSQPENNERLSKRLSLLNLEHNGTKLYVPVENPAAQLSASAPFSSFTSSSSSSRIPPSSENDMMQLDDSKYKVYIYSLDDELSSESEPEDGKLVFLPDIEKHLRNNRIPPQVLASPEPDLAGKELVLYSLPSSISIPEEYDSVRKAILEARSRVRERQKAEMEKMVVQTPAPLASFPSVGPESTDGNLNMPTTSRNLVAGLVQEDPDAMELD